MVKHDFDHTTTVEELENPPRLGLREAPRRAGNPGKALSRALRVTSEYLSHRRVKS